MAKVKVKPEEVIEDAELEDIDDVETEEEIEEEEVEVDDEPKALRCVSKTTIIHQGRVYLKGEEILLEKAQAKDMNKRGLISPPQK